MNTPRKTVGLAALGGFVIGCAVVGAISLTFIARANRQAEESYEQLALFRQIAERSFGDAADTARLRSLAQSVSAMAPDDLRPKAPRRLTEEDISLILLRLDRLPTLNAEVQAIADDPEAQILAADFKTLLERAGCKVGDVDPYPDTSKGVSIFSKSPYDTVLAEGVGFVFKKLNQPKVQWSPLPTTADPGSSPTPDLKIMIGHR